MAEGLIPAAFNLATRILGGTPNDTPSDTAQNVGERPETLQAQQRQLLNGQRLAQMFPRGTGEIQPPQGIQRVETPRGVFHYNPNTIDPNTIARLSGAGRENELLSLGPFSKEQIAPRVQAGEQPLAVVERGQDGTEIKSAVGTDRTAPIQRAAFELTKSPGSAIGLEPIENVVGGRFARGGVPSGQGSGQAHVGPIKSQVAGRTDHIAMRVPPNSFVIPADVVSGQGEGNTDAGQSVLLGMFPNSQAWDGIADNAIEIMAAGGEFVVSPKDCQIIGLGDQEDGHKILDKWVVDQRKRLVKTLSKLPGPVRA